LAHAASIGTVLGQFLSALHAIPVARMADVVDTDADPPTAWRRDAAQTYPRVAAHVPGAHRPAVEAFLTAPPPDDDWALAFSHNDLGIEHVLVDPVTWAVTGIIDWSDAAIADPAYDFGLIYRDLGPRALNAAIASYRTDPSHVDAERLRQRAVFYARCSVVEDLAYGVQTRQRIYVDNSIAACEWLFPA
jgi:aminoglycoside phosphotransferase (APT) family kinase protein